MDWGRPGAGFAREGPGQSRSLWTLVERDAFCAAALDASRPSMALAVMLGWCLGQRPADPQVLPWTAYDGLAVMLRQKKRARWSGFGCCRNCSRRWIAPRVLPPRSW